MIRLTFFLLLTGAVLLVAGIKYTNQEMRKIGLGLLVAGIILLILSRFTTVELLPS